MHLTTFDSTVLIKAMTPLGQYKKRDNLFELQNNGLFKNWHSDTKVYL